MKVFVGPGCRHNDTTLSQLAPLLRGYRSSVASANGVTYIVGDRTVACEKAAGPRQGRHQAGAVGPRAMRCHASVAHNQILNGASDISSPFIGIELTCWEAWSNRRFYDAQLPRRRALIALQQSGAGELGTGRGICCEGSNESAGFHRILALKLCCFRLRYPLRFVRPDGSCPAGKW